MANNENWYYSHDGGECQGPFTWKQINEYSEGGIITPHTMLRSSTIKEWVPAHHLIKRVDNSSNNTIILSIVLFIIAGVLCFGLLLWVSIDSYDNKSGIAWNAIKQELIAPSSAKQIKQQKWDSKKYESSVYHFEYDAQNGYGATIREHGFVFLYKSRSTGDWKIGMPPYANHNLTFLSIDEYASGVSEWNTLCLKDDMIALN